MINLFAAGAVVCAVLAIAADWNERRHRSFYVLKPLTTLLIAAFAATGAAVSPYRELVIVGLLASTVGDVCLMFKGNRWFIGGLVSFLCAHLLFVAAFLQGVAPIAVPWWAWLIVPYGAVLLWLLLPHAGPLKVPVVVYCAVIFAMVLAASARHAALAGPESLRALIGAFVFLVSDSALAVRQFRGSYGGAQALILSTYWLAIGLIASSV